MNKQYSIIELISPRSPEYISNNRRHRAMNMASRKKCGVDHFSRDYNKALLKWERVMQCLLSLLTTEMEDRILKYSGHYAGFDFREIDFIAQPSVDSLIFCELKLKKDFKKRLGSNASGWAQLNKSIAIAGQKYNQLGGLAICVDMSHVYGLTSSASDYDYCKYSDLVSYLLTPTNEHRTIWLSSLEISTLAIQHGLLTENDIGQMKKLYQEYENPLSVLPNGDAQEINNPFLALNKLLKS
jgi:hypothetical protein